MEKLVVVVKSEERKVTVDGDVRDITMKDDVVVMEKDEVNFIVFCDDIDLASFAMMRIEEYGKEYM